MVNVEVNEEYTFDVVPQTVNDYRVCKNILEWLKSNMENLTDTNDNKLFSKVNYGYNEQTLKGFGKKPVCDVYLTKTNYSDDFQHNHPSIVVSNIICSLKGNMNNAYIKAAELNDYLLQEFETNEDFHILELFEDDTTVRTIVGRTRVTDAEMKIIPQGKSYGVLVAFELEHTIL